MTKIKDLNFLYGDPLLHVSLMVFRSRSRNYVNKTLVDAGYTGELIPESAQGATTWIDGSENHGISFWVVWIPSKEHIIHELTHLVTGIMDQKGIVISRANDEIMAYLMEYWGIVLNGETPEQ